MCEAGGDGDGGARRNYDSAVVKRALHSKGPTTHDEGRRQFGLKCRSSSGMEFSSLFNSTQRQRLQQRNGGDKVDFMHGFTFTSTTSMLYARIRRLVMGHGRLCAVLSCFCF